MYALGQLGQVGERFMLYAEKGRRVMCPAGTTQESSGRMGTGQQYVQCYRPPVFAAPPTTTVTYEAPRTTVSVPTAVSTQVSPQISPTMAQQAASPGATVAAAPVAAPGAVAATPTTGITGADLERILAAQAAADEAEREARERKSQIEIETLRREMAERTRMTEDIEAARRADEARRIDAERFAREQAEAAAIESAGAIPPPPSITYAPTGGGMVPFVPPPPLEITTQARDVTVTAGAAEDGPPWALILLAAAGVGAVVIMGGKGKRKSRAKK